MNEITSNEVRTFKAETKKNSVLPMVKNTKIHCVRNGYTDESHNFRKETGFEVMVEIEGKGWFNYNSVLNHYGMKTTTNVFKTYETAKKMCDTIKNGWGKLSKKAKAEKSVKELTEAAQMKVYEAIATQMKCTIEEAKKMFAVAA